MTDIKGLIEALSENLYWQYKDVWDGYARDEIEIFDRLKNSEQAEKISEQLDELVIWKNSVSELVFAQKTKKISILTEHQSRGMSFAEWIDWASQYLRKEK